MKQPFKFFLRYIMSLNNMTALACFKSEINLYQSRIFFIMVACILTDNSYTKQVSKRRQLILNCLVGTCK